MLQQNSVIMVKIDDNYKKISIQNLLFRLTLLLLLIFFYNSCSKDLNKEQTSKMDSLLFAADDSIHTNPLFSLNLIKKAEKQVKDSLNYFKVINSYIIYYVENMQFDSANVYRLIFKSHINSIKANNKNYDRLLIYYNNSSGAILSNSAKFDSATYYFNNAYYLAKKNRYNSLFPDICINLADASIRKGDYVNGIKYYREALKATDSLKLGTKLRFPILMGLGQSYYAGLMNYNLSNTYFDYAEQIIDSVSITDKFRFYNNRGNFYYYKKEYKNSLRYFLKAKDIAESLHADYFINLCYANMSDVFLHLNKLDSAKYFCDISYKYFTQINISDFTSYLAIVRGGIALKEHDYALAKKMFCEYKDEDYQDVQLQILRYQLLEDYNCRIDNYKSAYKYLSKKVTLNDSLRSEAIQNAIAETDMRYRQDTAIIRQGYDLKTKDSKIKGLTIGGIAVVVLLIISVVAFVFFLISRKRKSELQRVKQTEALTKLRMQNIRNRISPHFLFNALNREVSLKIDTQERNELLSLINMLKRSLVLTDHVAVSLTDELDFVREYVEIEKRSFNSDFQYEISISNDVDILNTKVLAMMIQIPVENAIKHALRPKQGLKTLSITVTGNQEKTFIRIVDNGLGYKPEINTKSKGTGIGLKVIYQTMAVLNNNNKLKIEFDIQNIMEQDKTGTEVSITVPNKYNFEI